MRKVSKFTVLMLAAIFIAIGIFAGCETKPEDDSAKPETTAPSKTEESAARESATEEAAEEPPVEIDISKQVDLIMYFLSSPARDYDLMLDEVNKILKEDLNATITVNWIGWADYSTKYPLLLASGDPVDLVYAANWANYTQNAQKGAFLALEELLPIYAPKSYAQITPDFMEQATVDGHLYGVPASFYQYATMGFIVRGDLMDKYGMDSIDDMDDWAEFAANVLENDPEFEPGVWTGSDDKPNTYWVESLGYYDVLQTTFSPFMVKIDDEDATLVNLYELDGALEHFTKMKQWCDAGYWSKSLLSNKDTDLFANGKSASRWHNQSGWSSAYIAHPEWDVRFYTNASYTLKTAAMQDGMCVPSSSKNPERALMFLELLRTDQRYYDYFTYGIEGVHYEVTEDNQLKQLDLDGFTAEAYCSWGFKSLEFYIPPLGSPPNLDEMMGTLEEMGKDNPYVYFKPDFDPVKNEWAAIINVIQQYGLPLTYGLLNDPEEGLTTLLEELKKAGSETVMAEMQRQLDEYIGK